MQRYEPRPIRFHGLRSVDGWRLKRYSITFGPRPIDTRLRTADCGHKPREASRRQAKRPERHWAAFEPAMELVDAALPRPAATDARAGVGFVIAHQGRTARESESFCVVRAYLGATLSRGAAGARPTAGAAAP